MSALKALSLTGGTLAGNLVFKAATLDRDGADPNPYVVEDGRCIQFEDKDGETVGRVRMWRNTDGTQYTQIATWNETGSLGFSVGVAKDGPAKYAVGGSAAFRQAIDAPSTTCSGWINADTYTGDTDRGITVGGVVNNSTSVLNGHSISLYITANGMSLWDSTAGATKWRVSTQGHTHNMLSSLSTRPASANIDNGDGGLRYFLATSSMTTGKPPGDAHIIHLDWDNTANYAVQLAVGNSGPKMWIRSHNGGTWTSWSEVTLSDKTETNATNVTTYVSSGNFHIVKRGNVVQMTVAVTFKAYSGKQTVANIPAGYRPESTAYCVLNPLKTAPNGYIIINTNGTIQFDGPSEAGTRYGSCTWVVA